MYVCVLLTVCVGPVPGGVRCAAGPQRSVLQPGPVLSGRLQGVRGGAHIGGVCPAQCGKGPGQGPGEPPGARGGPGTPGTVTTPLILANGVLCCEGKMTSVD